MTALPDSLREVLDAGPLVHLATVSPDGSPQVSMVWVQRDGDELLTAHMSRYAKVRNLERDPRAVLSFLAPSPPGVFLAHHALLKARARVEATDDAWDLLDRMTKTYLGPDETFPAPQGPGYVVHYEVEKIGGVGPWVSGEAS